VLADYSLPDFIPPESRSGGLGDVRQHAIGKV
jgi:hypothetical protein